MAFHLHEDSEQGMTDMNLIPLIDIMLVLMIIFLVTATVLSPAVPLNLPKADAAPLQQKPQVIQLSIAADGQIFWDQQPLSLIQLEQRMAQAAQGASKPSLQLRADKNVRYDRVAQVLARSSQAGLTDLAFLSDTAH